MEYPENMKGCLAYTRYAPVCGDGTHMACFIEVVRDLNWRVPYRHNDQKVQTPNEEAERLPGYAQGPSVYYKALHIHHVSFEDIPKDAEFTLVWNPAL